MRSAWLRNLLPDEIGDKQFGLRPGVAREDIALANAEVGFGFSRTTMRLTRTEGPRWTHEVDEHVAPSSPDSTPKAQPARDHRAICRGQ